MQKIYKVLRDFKIEETPMPNLLNKNCYATFTVDADFTEITTRECVDHISWNQTDVELTDYDVYDLEIYDEDHNLILKVEKLSSELKRHFAEKVYEHEEYANE